MSKARKIILLAAVFAVAFALGNAVKYYLDIWKADRNVKNFQSAFDALYKDDAYGGKTPEETFDLYLAALKKGDLELASRYFVMEKQKNIADNLKKKDSQEIKNYITKLESVPKKWVAQGTEDNIKVYVYTEVVDRATQVNFLGQNVDVPVGNYGATIKFKEIKNNFWKLYLM